MSPAIQNWTKIDPFLAPNAVSFFFPLSHLLCQLFLSWWVMIAKQCNKLNALISCEAPKTVCTRLPGRRGQSGTSEVYEWSLQRGTRGRIQLRVLVLVSVNKCTHDKMNCIFTRLKLHSIILKGFMKNLFFNKWPKKKKNNTVQFSGRNVQHRHSAISASTGQCMSVASGLKNK